MINMFCKFANFTFNLIELEEMVNKTSNPKENVTSQNWRNCSVAVKSGILTINAIEIIAKLGNASSSHLSAVKSLESLIRAIDIPVEMAKAALDFQNSNLSLSAAIEKGLLVPITRFACTLAEKNLLDQKTYLEMTKEELAEINRPVYEWSEKEECMVITDYVPVDLDECRKIIEQYKDISDSSCVAAMLFKLGLVDKTTAYYCNLANDLLSKQESPKEQESLKEKNEALNQLYSKQPIDMDPFNLRNKYVIPKCMFKDKVFEKYICVLTQKPIRFPIRYQAHIYERDVFLDYIKTHEFDPMTNMSFNVNDIKEMPNLQLMIDERLAMHSRKLRCSARLLSNEYNPKQFAPLEKNANKEVNEVKSHWEKIEDIKL